MALGLRAFSRRDPVPAQAVSGGKIEINGERVKPSRVVRIGDKVGIRRGLYRVDNYRQSHGAAAPPRGSSTTTKKPKQVGVESSIAWFESINQIPVRSIEEKEVNGALSVIERRADGAIRQVDGHGRPEGPMIVAEELGFFDPGITVAAKNVCRPGVAACFVVFYSSRDDSAAVPSHRDRGAEEIKLIRVVCHELSLLNPVATIQTQRRKRRPPAPRRFGHRERRRQRSGHR